MESAEAGFAFASGMSAVFSTFAALLDSGDHILSCGSIFGSTQGVFTEVFPRWNITKTFAPIGDTESWHGLVQKNTKILFVETPTNPGVDLIDLEWLGNFAQEHELMLIVDNCFATPYLQQPIRYGADLVLHSATKFIDGQGRVLGGAVVGREELIYKIYRFARRTGPTLSAFNAWLLSKSLETLAVRMDRHCENALEIACRLEQHIDVESVQYPFLQSSPYYELAKKQMRAGGGVLAFRASGGLEQGRRFIDTIKMISRTGNLGDTRTIATHPASTTHAKVSEESRLAAGITPGMIRVSVGLEHVDDIWQDIEQALKS
jgi:O-succinylhomoserine sulfhydrylase